MGCRDQEICEFRWEWEISIAEGLDLPAYALKRLLNHKMNNDVTAGYIMRDVERLRKPMQRIADFLFENMQKESQRFESENPEKIMLDVE